MGVNNQKPALLNRSAVMPFCTAAHLVLCAGALSIALCALFCHWKLDSTDVHALSVGSREPAQFTAAVQSSRRLPDLHGPPQQPSSTQGCIRLCYYVLPHHNSEDELQPEAVDPLLCSHLVVVAEGAHILNDTIQLGLARNAELLKRVVALKSQNPRLRVLLSLMFGFTELVRNHTAVISFAYNARMFVEQHGLDGLDLDWEFPAWSPDPRRGEKGLFVVLLDKLSTALRLVEPSYLITVAVTGIQPILDHSYDIPGLTRNADFISLMGYDYHMYKSYLPFTGHNAPLTPHRNDVGYFAFLNVEASVAALRERGLPLNKLLVGVPTYGRTWRLASSQYQHLGSLAVGEGFGGGYVSYAGAWAFARSADLVAMDEEAAVPYAARGTDWVSYENMQSISAKVNFIKEAGVAGAMTFHLGSDDWAGVTGHRFPLHSVVRRGLCSTSGCCPAPLVQPHPTPHTISSLLNADRRFMLNSPGAHQNATRFVMSFGKENNFRFSFYEGSGMDAEKSDSSVRYNVGFDTVPAFKMSHDNVTKKKFELNDMKINDGSEWRKLSSNKKNDKQKQRILLELRRKLNSSNEQKPSNDYNFMSKKQEPEADRTWAGHAVRKSKAKSSGHSDARAGVPEDRNSGAGAGVPEDHDSDARAGVPEDHDSDARAGVPEDCNSGAGAGVPEDHDSDARAGVPEDHDSDTRAGVPEDHDSDARAGVPEDSNSGARAGVPEDHDSDARAGVPEDHDSDTRAGVPEDHDSDARANIPSKRLESNISEALPSASRLYSVRNLDTLTLSHPQKVLLKISRIFNRMKSRAFVKP